MPNVNKLIYAKLSYSIVGDLFAVHNELGSYCKEKQYCDLIEKILKKSNIKYKREVVMGNTGNIADFVVEDKILLETRSKRIITKSDYDQIQRYFQHTKLKLGLLVNFRSRFLNPKRIIRKDIEFKKAISCLFVVFVLIRILAS